MTVSALHIQYLVTAFAEWVSDERGPQEIGQILIDELCRAASHRHGTEVDAHEYQHVPSELPLEPVQILKATAFIRFSVAEPRDYRSTAAWQILGDLERAAIRRLPGYFEAKWELE